MQVNIKNLVDDAPCDDTVRELRWPEGKQCPCCDSTRVIQRGVDDQEPARQRYECRAGSNEMDQPLLSTASKSQNGGGISGNHSLQGGESNGTADDRIGNRHGNIGSEATKGRKVA